LARRRRAERDFRFFCEAYFGHLLTLEWSPDHLTVIALIERTVLHNERFAVAMPRGSGKTTLCEVAVIWGALIGLHSFVYLIAATEEHAAEFMTNIKAHIRWDDDKIIFATIPACRCSGTIIKCASLGSAIRGAKVNRPTDGTALRPMLAIIDDPQSDKSAKSPTQVRERLGIINGAISGLPGPEKTIGIIVPCTVIALNDVADQLVNRDKNPLWQGIRTKLVNAFPTNEELWAEYRRLRDNSFHIGRQGEEAHEFYQQHQAEMDEGASLAWPERHPGCLSALQFAMHLRFASEAKFFAEYQNEPLSDRPVQDDLLTADEIAEKTNGLKRGIVPLNANTVTAFIDVHQKALYDVVAAGCWHEDRPRLGHASDPEYATLPAHPFRYEQVEVVCSGQARNAARRPWQPQSFRTRPRDAHDVRWRKSWAKISRRR
jgi:hypothetical protein